MEVKEAKVSIGKAAYRTELKIREHSLIADEPKELGGTDQGPTPSELLAAALGSCMAITMRMYADRKAWPLDGVDVHVKHSKEPMEGEAANVLQSIFRVQVELKGDLDEAQVKRIRDIGTKCPVHKVLIEASQILMV